MSEPQRLFLPGWGARAGAYAAGLPQGWTALEPPRFRETRGSFLSYTGWLGRELAERPGRLVLAGHSMGGALALLAAGAAPDRIEHLVLISPAGLPLVKPMAMSAAQFFGQVADRRFSLRQARESLADVLGAPRSAFRVAQAVRQLDLSLEMRALRAERVPVTVIGCTTDTLVTSRHTRRAADLLAARYRELDCEGGHMWMFGRWPRLAGELSRF